MGRIAKKLTSKNIEYVISQIKIKTIRELARELEIDHSYLRKHLKKCRNYREKHPGGKIKEVSIEQILILYKSGLGCEKIGRSLGISTSTVSRRIIAEVGTLRTMKMVWEMRKNGESEESITDLMARSGGKAKHKLAVERFNELQKFGSNYDK